MSQGFIPRRITLADALTNPTVPEYGAFNLLWNGTTWDRAFAAKLVDLDTASPGTEYNLGVNLRTGAGGGGVETGISTNPLYTRLSSGMVTISAESYTAVEGLEVFSLPLVYNQNAGNWERMARAQLGWSAYTGSAGPLTGLLVVAPAGYYNSSVNADPPSSNSFHTVNITQKRAWHSNLRDASGNEVGLAAAPVYVGPSTISSNAATAAFLTIATDHAEVHDGDAYSTWWAATGKTTSQTVNIYLKTPNTTKNIHMIAAWAASGESIARIYEAPTITSNTGTNGITATNRNRNISDASGVLDNATSPAAGKVGRDVTKTADGTILYTEYAGAGKNFGGENRGEQEWVLKQNTVYLFEVESRVAGGISLNLFLAWYEHTNVA